MLKKLYELKWMIFRKRHVYFVHYTVKEVDENGITREVKRKLTIVTTMNPRKLTFNTLQHLLQKEENDVTIEVDTYNYLGKW